MGELHRPASPSPLAGEGLGRGDGGNSRPKTLTEIAARSALIDQRAKSMRSGPTEAEHRLWNILRAKRLPPLKWRRQVRFDDRFIADFVCFAHRLIVEADGGQHGDCGPDAVRDAWFAEQGFNVLRFWNNDILTNAEGVVAAILLAIESSCAADAARPSPQPLPREGGGESPGVPHA